MQARRPSGRASLQCFVCTERVVLLCRGCTQRTERACMPVRPQLRLHGSHSPVTHLPGHTAHGQPPEKPRRAGARQPVPPGASSLRPEGALRPAAPLPEVLQTTNPKRAHCWETLVQGEPLSFLSLLTLTSPTFLGSSMDALSACPQRAPTCRFTHHLPCLGPCKRNLGPEMQPHQIPGLEGQGCSPWDEL